MAYTDGLEFRFTADAGPVVNELNRINNAVKGTEQLAKNLNNTLKSTGASTGGGRSGGGKSPLQQQIDAEYKAQVSAGRQIEQLLQTRVDKEYALQTKLAKQLESLRAKDAQNQIKQQEAIERAMARSLQRQIDYEYSLEKQRVKNAEAVERERARAIQRGVDTEYQAQRTGQRRLEQALQTHVNFLYRTERESNQQRVANLQNSLNRDYQAWVDFEKKVARVARQEAKDVEDARKEQARAQAQADKEAAQPGFIQQGLQSAITSIAGGNILATAILGTFNAIKSAISEVIGLVEEFASAVAGAFASFIRSGFEMARTLEITKRGLAALISLNFGIENFGDAMQFAQQMTEQLRIAAIKTPLTFVELQQALQATSAQAAEAGIKMDELVPLTVKLASAVKTLGLDSRQVVQETRALLTGRITSSELLGRALGLNSKIIKQWKQEGTFVEHLNALLEPFVKALDLASADMDVLTSAAADIYQNFARLSIAKLYEEVRQTLVILINWSQSLDEGKVGLDRIAGIISTILGDVGAGLAPATQQIIGLLNGVEGLLETNETRLRGLAEIAGKDIYSAITKAIDGLGIVLRYLDNYSAQIKQIGLSSLDVFGTIIDLLVETLGLIGDILTAGDQVNKNGKGTSTILDRIVYILNEVNTLLGVVVQYMKATRVIIELITSNLNTIKVLFGGIASETSAWSVAIGGAVGLLQGAYSIALKINNLFGGGIAGAATGSAKAIPFAATAKITGGYAQRPPPDKTGTGKADGDARKIAASAEKIGDAIKKITDETNQLKAALPLTVAQFDQLRDAFAGVDPANANDFIDGVSRVRGIFSDPAFGRGPSLLSQARKEFEATSQAIAKFNEGQRVQLKSGAFRQVTPTPEQQVEFANKALEGLSVKYGALIAKSEDFVRGAEGNIQDINDQIAEGANAVDARYQKMIRSIRNFKDKVDHDTLLGPGVAQKLKDDFQSASEGLFNQEQINKAEEYWNQIDQMQIQAITNASQRQLAEIQAQGEAYRLEVSKNIKNETQADQIVAAYKYALMLKYWNDQRIFANNLANEQKDLANQLIGDTRARLKAERELAALKAAQAVDPKFNPNAPRSGREDPQSAAGQYNLSLQNSQMRELVGLVAQLQQQLATPFHIFTPEDDQRITALAQHMQDLGITLDGVGKAFGFVSSNFDNLNRQVDALAKIQAGDISGGIIEGLKAITAEALFSQQAFVSFGDAAGNAILGLINGTETVGSSLKKFFFGLLGDLAIQFGTFLIGIGVGINAVGFLFGISGFAAVAAGVALVALGTVLKGLAGAQGSDASTAAPAAPAAQNSPQQREHRVKRTMFGTSGEHPGPSPLPFLGGDFPGGQVGVALQISVSADPGTAVSAITAAVGRGSARRVFKRKVA